MNLQMIIGDLISERAYQDQKHGGVSNDDRNTLSDWFRWVGEHEADASRDVGRGTRQELVACAALFIAAIEAYDRNGGFPQ